LITINGTDLDDLWINYLRELLYLWSGNAFLVRTVDILNIGKHTLSMIVKGEPLNVKKHEILTEIKAVTYHQGGIKKTVKGWTGRFIVDV
jgi:SHS2 domain-containing protein